MKTKSHFQSQLWTAWTDKTDAFDRPLCSLIQPLIFFSETYGLHTVPTGFITNFANVPRLPLMYLFFGNTAHAAAVMHDWATDADQNPAPWSWSDGLTLFGECMRASGVPIWRRWPMQTGVRVGGWLRKVGIYL